MWLRKKANKKPPIPWAGRRLPGTTESRVDAGTNREATETRDSIEKLWGKKLRQMAHSGTLTLCKNPDTVQNPFPHPRICGYGHFK
jgi:hypothetical protein